MKNLKLDQFLDKEVDLTQFFSQKELDDMGIHQQTRLKNIAQNYEIMLYMGKFEYDNFIHRKTFFMPPKGGI